LGNAKLADVLAAAAAVVDVDDDWQAA